MKKTVLINVSYLMDLEDEEINKDFGWIEKVPNKLSNDQIIKVGTDEVEVQWKGTSTLILDPNKINCGKCANCRSWVTDREKINPVLELCNGATFEGKLLCDECLPEHHRWAF